MIATSMTRTPSVVSAADVRAHFRRSSYPQLANYVDAVDDGVVTLQGTAPSFYAKQVIQTIAARCPGIASVRNKVQVSKSAPR